MELLWIAAVILRKTVCAFSYSVMSDCDSMDCKPNRLLCPGVFFSQARSWDGLPFSPPGDLPNTRTKSTYTVSLALAGKCFTTEPPGKFNY